MSEVRDIISTKSIARRTLNVDKDTKIFLIRKWKDEDLLLKAKKMYDTIVTMANEASEIFKSKIPRYGHWIWYEWI